MTPTYEEAMGRSALYELLSLAFLYPNPGARETLAGGARKLEAWTGQGHQPGVARALGDLAAALERSTDEALEGDHIAVFGHTVSSDCPPYESEYGQAHIFQKSQALIDLGAFYQAFGVQANPDLKERPDHISVELEFMHLLTMKEAYAAKNSHGNGRVWICREAQEAFLAQHLVPWVRTFTVRMGEKVGSSNVYRSFAALLDAFLAGEAEAFRLETPAARPLKAEERTDDSDGCEAGPVAANGIPLGGLV